MRSLFTVLIQFFLLCPAIATANSQCAKIGHLATIVVLTDQHLDPDALARNSRLQRLDKTVAALTPRSLHRQLLVTGQEAHLSLAQTYIRDLKRVLQTHHLTGPTAAARLLHSPAFQARHTRLLGVIQSLCAPTLWQKTRLIAAQITAGLGQTAKSQLETKTLTMTAIQQSRALNSYTIRKEAVMLMQVFCLLGLTMALLFTLNHLMKLLRAIRLDRYACAIPSVLKVGDMSFSGRIDVLGNRGLSFEVAGPSLPAHYTTLTLDRSVKIITDVCGVHATLTKAFDGSAGFRLSVPLKKPKLAELLALSMIKPRRKLEMGQKKKPATPGRASLAG